MSNDNLKKIFNFQQFYLKKSINLLVIIGLILSISIFLLFKIDIVYKYFLSMVIVFLGVLIVFYLNKYHLEKLIINAKLHFIYSNKFFFKKKDKEIGINEVEVDKKNNAKLTISSKGKIVAIVRRNSLNDIEWREINDVLTQL